MKLWESESYYKKAHHGSSDSKHPGMEALKSISKSAESILDLGCGEGTRLAFVAKGKKGVGVDISSTAIALAKRKYPQFSFKKMDLERLSFANESFDLVYSAYVLEHLDNPEKMINEAIRVVSKKGHIVFIAPNYGAPNRSSPVYKGSRPLKLLRGTIKDLTFFMRENKQMYWERVTPIDDVESYMPDSDTKCEPYLSTLIGFLKSHDMKIISYTSCWKEELPGAKPHQKIFRILGEAHVYPFLLWGPHLVVVARKEK